MAIQNLFTSRDNNLDGNTYVGQLGRLWYNPDTNSLYASDGETVGGVPVDLATNANILANNLTVTQITSTSGTVTVTGNLAITGNISPASNCQNWWSTCRSGRQHFKHWLAHNRHCRLATQLW
jgi:hypothetical protein